MDESEPESYQEKLKAKARQARRDAYQKMKEKRKVEKQKLAQSPEMIARKQALKDKAKQYRHAAYLRAKELKKQKSSTDKAAKKTSREPPAAADQVLDPQKLKLVVFNSDQDEFVPALTTPPVLRIVAPDEDSDSPKSKA